LERYESRKGPGGGFFRVGGHWKERREGRGGVTPKTKDTRGRAPKEREKKSRGRVERKVRAEGGEELRKGNGKMNKHKEGQ